MTEKKTENLLDVDTIGAEPIGEVATAAGQLFVYGPGDITVREVQDLRGVSGHERGQKMLPILVRQQRRERWSDDVPHLPADVQAQLTESDVGEVANMLRGAVDAGAKLDDNAAEELTPYAYLAAIVDANLDAHSAKLRDTLTKAVGLDMGRMFGDLQASRIKLGGTAQALSALSSPLHSMPDTSHLDELARQRREDRERDILTSRATAESAQLLTKLVANAEKLMAELARSNADGKVEFRWQMWVAALSLFVGMVLSGGALWYAKKSYEQDLEKAKADDLAAKQTAARDERMTKAVEQTTLLLQLNEKLVGEVKRLSEERAEGTQPKAPSGAAARP